MDLIAAVLGLASVSLAVAFFTGISLGLYLAAIHRFIPTTSLTRSLITDGVIGLSFFAPLAMQRLLSNSPSLTPEAWFAFILLWLVFSITADVSNYLFCRIHWYRLSRWGK
jgi:hypothetical protein